MSRVPGATFSKQLQRCRVLHNVRLFRCSGRGLQDRSKTDQECGMGWIRIRMIILPKESRPGGGTVERGFVVLRVDRKRDEQRDCQDNC
jgi:hypothetical protein